MNAKFKNFIYLSIAKTINTELAKAIDEEKGFFELDTRSINLLGDLAEAWNIKARYGQSRARTLWYRILEGSEQATY